MKNFINWIVSNPAMSKVSGLASKIFGTFGASIGIASVFKSQDKKAELYYKSGMTETQAQGLAWSDTFSEIPANLVTRGNSGFVKSAVEKILKFTYRETSSKAHTDKTLEEFYSTRSNSKIFVNNPTINNSDGSILKLDGPVNTDDLQAIQRIQNNSLIKGNSANKNTLKGRVEEIRYLDGQSTGQASPVVNNGLSNSNAFANVVVQQAQPNAGLINLDYLKGLPTPSVASAGSVILSSVISLGTTALGAIVGSAAINAVGPRVELNVSAVPRFHEGGKVPGTGDVLAVLKGGETVRTKAQEEELRQQVIQNHLENFAPLVCGGQDDSNKETRDPNQNKPIHQQITRDDEIFILKLVADALERNRMGMRNLVKAL